MTLDPKAKVISVFNLFTVRFFILWMVFIFSTMITDGMSITTKISDH